MKNNIFSKSINYVAALALLAMLGLLPSTPTEAQTPISWQYYYSTAPVSEVIVRDHPINGELMLAYRHDGLSFNGIWFLYHYSFPNVAIQFNIPDTISSNITIRYHINDMAVSRRRGYFCGTRVTITLTQDDVTGETVETVDSVGILGYYDLYASGFNDPVKAHIKLMHETKSLKRMEYSSSDDYAMVAMIGVAKLPGSPSCLVVASNQVNPESWYYSVRYTNDDTETFTDIAINAKEVVVASQCAGEANRKYFFLRMARKDDIVLYNDYLNLNYRHRFSPCDLFSPPRNILQHPEGADIRLCAVPDDSYVHVAYTCGSNDLNHPCATILCGVPTAGLIEMDNVQIVKESYDTMSSFVDMKYQDDGTETTVALLYTDVNEEVGTMVLYPFAFNSAYGTPSIALKQVLQDNRMQSMSIYNGNSVRLAGVWDLASYNLTSLQQTKPHIIDKSKCMDNGYTEVELIMSSQVATNSTKILHSYPNQQMVQLNWGDEKSYPTMTLGKQKVCERE